MIDHVQPSELTSWLEKMKPHGQAVVLDVRELRELQMASIKANGFELLHIPMNSIPPRLAELDPSRPVACLCHHGSRSMQVAHFLSAQGFEHVANLSGGIDAWTTQIDSAVARY